MKADHIWPAVRRENSLFVPGEQSKSERGRKIFF